jgi:ArsR family transcriptional regulator
MKILTESGLVRGRKEGRWTYYSLDAEGIAHAKEIFDAVTAVVPNPVPVCACAD